ncbi:MAG TPA: preprotein translocase subunit SecA [Steroidobacteraceae bacterium]|nr:preprotein translocase subunit SecA [Steroidobacteraceae bacterium]
MWKLLTRVFGSRNQRLIKEMGRSVAAINALEPEVRELRDEQFPEKTQDLKARFAGGATLDALAPEAFALVREASRRKLGLRHFDVQLIGGLVLNAGKIAEMRTGEGKTLMATLPAYLNALTNEGVHVVTVNEYLAQRDSDWMAPVYRFLGLQVGVIKNAQSQDEKRAAYACDITYGTNNEFGFDYLRDNLAFRLEERVQRKLPFAIVDEVDSILIDEARTPLIISGPAEESTELYIKINALVPKLSRAPLEEAVDRGLLVAQTEAKRVRGDLRRGDVILSVNGDNVATADDLARALGRGRASLKAKLEIWRDRRVHVASVDFAAATEGAAAAAESAVAESAAAANAPAQPVVPEPAVPEVDADADAPDEQARDDVEMRLLRTIGVAARRPTAQERHALAVDGDFWVDEKAKQATLTETGHQRIEELFTSSGLLREDESLYDAGNIRLMHHLNAALRAHAIYKRDVDYIVRGGEVIIVDEFTGRTMPGRRWSDGLHQAVEAKEGVQVREENQTVASITFQNYFRLYSKLSGMTGTADTEAFEFQEIYGLEVAVIPTHKPMIRNDRADLVFLGETDKFQAIREDIADCAKRGQPVLVGTTSIETSERLAKLLAGEKIAHQVLNAKQHEREAHIVAEAGRPGAVTIATNMAGRGTDIVLGGSTQIQIDALRNPSADDLQKIRDEWRERHEQVLAAGGLHIIGTERHESRRIDNQLRGRSGRQGDPGSSRFYLSLEDNLMRIFGDPARMKGLMTRVGMKAGEAIESGMLTRQIERAQRRVEQHNFDARKQLLEYDDVANDQRRVIYQQRTDLMAAEDVAEAVVGVREEVVDKLVDEFVPPAAPEDQWDVPGLAAAVERDFGPRLPIEQWLAAEASGDGTSLKKKVLEALEAAYREKLDGVGAEVMRYIEKEVMLRTLDQHWREHLAAMDYMRQGIYLRGYAQKDPKQEYKREAFALFSAMLDRIKLDTITTVSKIQVRSQEEIEREELERQRRLARALQMQHAEAISPIQAGPGGALGMGGEPGAGGDDGMLAPPPPTVPFVRAVPKVGRNEPCPCGSGRKYKHCHGALQQANG